MADRSPPKGWHLYFLSWLDAIEKLDILVLELRHLQFTCVYGLRLPALQEQLRVEEALLDPRSVTAEKWEEITQLLELDITDDPLQMARHIAEKFVPLFPDIACKETAKQNDNDELRKTLKSQWENGDWSDARKDFYYVLRAAQQLKRQVFADRLTLFLEGRQALGLHTVPLNRKVGHYDCAEAFLLRIAILSRSHNYLERIGDLQQRLAQHLEASAPEFPRPSVHRRRIQGVYTHYLIERVQYLRQSMNDVLAALADRDHAKPTPLILHRWEHSHTSHQGVFTDEVSKLKPEDHDFVEFVQTGFWMPDKPDNQAILAHEVAHHAIRQHYDNLLPQTLAHAAVDDRFAALMRRLIHALGSFQVPHSGDTWQSDSDLISPLELACDLLSGAVKGISYLYAFFMEVVGWGLEQTMVDQCGYLPHLSVNLELRKWFSASRARHLRDWYVRGRILIAWLHATESIRSELDLTMAGDIETILDELNTLLDRASLNLTDQSGAFWRALADRMCAIVETSEAAERVASWRQERRRDNFSKDKCFPRASQRLPLALRNFLVKALVANKFESLYDIRTDERMSEGATGVDADNLTDRYLKNLCAVLDADAPLGTDNHAQDQNADDLATRFLEKVYGVSHNTKLPASEMEAQNQDDMRPLFKHVFDIPWQCAMIRAKDFFASDECRNVSRLYTEINTNTSLGRRLFFIAMEADLFLTQSPCERLRTVIRLANTHRFDWGTQHEWHSLATWLAGWIASAKMLLNKELEARKGGNSAEVRRCQKAQGHEVQRLSVRFNKIAANDISVWDKFFGPGAAKIVPSYLTIHHTRTYEETNNFYLAICEMFNQGTSECPRVRFDLASRMCFSSTYHSQSGFKSNAALEFAASVQENHPHATADCEYQSATLGYYNALMVFRNIRPLCRCILPNLVDADKKPLHIPLFMRRESWIATRRFDWRKEQSAGSAPAAAVLYVQLARRLGRLDFLYWLHKEGGEVLRLGREDTVFLTDGWADFALVLGAEGPEKQQRFLEDIFTLQSEVYQNPLVGRTELVPTASCLDLDMRDPERLVLHLSVRTDECRHNSRIYERFQDQIRNRVSSAIATQLPGRMDFTLSFYGMSCPSYDEIMKALRTPEIGTLIDQIAMQIGLRSP